MTNTPKTYRVLELKPSSDTASKPSELIQIRGHDGLTLNARRAITLLWHNAHRQGIEENKDYTIEIDQLMPLRHKGYEMVEEAIEALMTTLIMVPLPDGSTRRVQVLGGNDLTDKNRRAGTLTYSFDRRLVEVLRDSAIWGKISIPELMAFSYRYSITLYEHISQWIGLTQMQGKTFNLEEFRHVLGVTPNKYKAFGGLNQQVLKPVLAEINALAPFNVAIQPIKTGKSVTHIRLQWWEKSIPERQEAYAEVNRSKIGRRARIKGNVEYVLPSVSSPQRLVRDARKSATKNDDSLIE